MIAKGEPETPPARLSSAACREDACGGPSLDAMNLGTSFNNLSYDGSKDHVLILYVVLITGVKESDGRILTNTLEGVL